LARGEFHLLDRGRQSRTGPESAGFCGPRRSWRKASAGPAAGRGVSTASAPAGSLLRWIIIASPGARYADGTRAAEAQDSSLAGPRRLLCLASASQGRCRSRRWSGRWGTARALSPM